MYRALGLGRDGAITQVLERVPGIANIVATAHENAGHHEHARRAEERGTEALTHLLHPIAPDGGKVEFIFKNRTMLSWTLDSHWSRKNLFRESGIQGELPLLMDSPFHARGSGYACYRNDATSTVLVLGYSNPSVGENKISGTFISTEEFSEDFAMDFWKNSRTACYDAEKAVSAEVFGNETVLPSHRRSRLTLTFRNHPGYPATGQWVLSWEGLGSIERSLPPTQRYAPDHALPQPRPPFLGTSTQELVDMQFTDPTRWGMTLGQWKRVVNHCKETELYQDLKMQNGDVNFYEINDHFVKPWTAGEYCSIALLMNAETLGRTPTLMVSHAWAADVEQDEECLQSLPEDVVLWFCVFAQFQGNAQQIGQQLNLDPFKKVIQSVSFMAVLHTSAADVYTRLWCVYEMDAAKEEGTTVFPLCSREWALDVTRNGTWGRIDTSRATCGMPEDERRIRDEVFEHGGFNRLDQVINDFRMQALPELMIR